MSNLMLTDAPAATSPLVWWRTLPADELRPRDLSRLRAAMAGVELLGEDKWADAQRGAAAEAIGIAVRITLKQTAAELVVDLVMSAVLGAAIEGDPAAQTFLTHILQRRRRVDPQAKKLAASWITASAMAAKARRASQPRVRLRPQQRRRIASCGGTFRR